MLVLQVYPESEVDPVFQDKEKGVRVCHKYQTGEFPTAMFYFHIQMTFYKKDNSGETNKYF